jgi:hypothetical protein
LLIIGGPSFCENHSAGAFETLNSKHCHNKLQSVNLFLNSIHTCVYTEGNIMNISC